LPSAAGFVMLHCNSIAIWITFTISVVANDPLSKQA